MSTQAIALNRTHVEKALSDDQFTKLMPEFLSIRVQKETMKINLESHEGCSACNRRRFHANLDSNFATVAAVLMPERAAVLKEYLGIPSGMKLVVRAVNPATHQPFTKLI